MTKPRQPRGLNGIDMVDDGTPDSRAQRSDPALDASLRLGGACIREMLRLVRDGDHVTYQLLRGMTEPGTLDRQLVERSWDRRRR